VVVNARLPPAEIRGHKLISDSKLAVHQGLHMICFSPSAIV
jgi:hypothetical protein